MERYIMRISLLTPTRGRPHKMESVWKSALTTADAPNDLEVVFYLDNDDDNGISKLKDMRSDQIKSKIGCRMPIENGANMWNEAYKAAVGEIFMLCADDVLFRTQGWDTVVRGEFEKRSDRIVYVNGNDKGPFYRRWGTHGFVHKNWIDVIGYFAPPIYFYGVDDYYTYVSKSLGRAVFLDHVVIEHMHWTLKKTKEDEEVFKAGGDETSRFRNKHFHKCVANMNKYKHQKPPSPGYSNDILKLKTFIEEFCQRK